MFKKVGTLCVHIMLITLGSIFNKDVRTFMIIQQELYSLNDKHVHTHHSYDGCEP